jgi:hypothetical protein
MALNMATASSGSDIDAKDLLANSKCCRIKRTTISVHPIVSLKAKASSGSNIDYNTTKINRKRSSSGASIDKI